MFIGFPGSLSTAAYSKSFASTENHIITSHITILFCFVFLLSWKKKNLLIFCCRLISQQSNCRSGTNAVSQCASSFQSRAFSIYLFCRFFFCGHKSQPTTIYLSTGQLTATKNLFSLVVVLFSYCFCSKLVIWSFISSNGNSHHQRVEWNGMYFSPERRVSLVLFILVDAIADGIWLLSRWQFGYINFHNALVVARARTCARSHKSHRSGKLIGF